MSARKASHGTIFLIVSSGSPLALIASSRRSTSKKPFCPMTRSLHPPATAGGQRVRFATTWRDEFFEVPKSEYEPTNGRSIYYGSGCLIPAFHGIERTFPWLLSLRLDAPGRPLVSCLRRNKAEGWFDLHFLDNDLHFLENYLSDFRFGIAWTVQGSDPLDLSMRKPP